MMNAYFFTGVDNFRTGFPVAWEQITKRISHELYFLEQNKIADVTELNFGACLHIVEVEENKVICSIPFGRKPNEEHFLASVKYSEYENIRRGFSSSSASYNDEISEVPGCAIYANFGNLYRYVFSFAGLQKELSEWILIKLIEQIENLSTTKMLTGRNYFMKSNYYCRNYDNSFYNYIK